MNTENTADSTAAAGGAPDPQVEANKEVVVDTHGDAGEKPQESAEDALAREFGQVDEPAPDADTGDAGGDTGEQPPEEPKKGKSAQERIDELTAQAREADRRAAEAERKLAEASAKPPEDATGDTAAAADEGDGEPNPDDYEYGEADAAFIKDSATYHARAEFQRQENLRRLQTEFKQIDDGYAARVEEAVTRYPDFEEKVVKGANAPEPTWEATPVMALAMKTSDVGPDVAYHLATNPEESKRIARLSPLEQAREMGRLEGRFTRPSTPAPKKESAAPPPPTTVTRGAGGQFKVAADTDDFSSFDKAY